MDVLRAAPLGGGARRAARYALWAEEWRREPMVRHGGGRRGGGEAQRPLKRPVVPRGTLGDDRAPAIQQIQCISIQQRFSSRVQIQ
eukprot:5010494-Prymnesium_polylepis.1